MQNLQRSYGYYVDKHMWDEVADLFADDATLEIGGRGVFVGKPRVREYLYFLGQKARHTAGCYDHSQWQLIVHVAEDGADRERSLAGVHHGRRAETREHRLDRCRVRRGYGVRRSDVRESVREAERRVEDQPAATPYFNMYTPYSAGWARWACPTRIRKRADADPPPTVKYQTYPTLDSCHITIATRRAAIPAHSCTLIYAAPIAR